MNLYTKTASALLTDAKNIFTKGKDSYVKVTADADAEVERLSPAQLKKLLDGKAKPRDKNSRSNDRQN